MKAQGIIEEVKHERGFKGSNTRVTINLYNISAELMEQLTKTFESTPGGSVEMRAVLEFGAVASRQVTMTIRKP